MASHRKALDSLLSCNVCGADVRVKDAEPTRCEVAGRSVQLCFCPSCGLRRRMGERLRLRWPVEIPGLRLTLHSGEVVR